MKLIWESKPTLVIETGVAKGGSLLFASQMLDLIYGADGRERWRVIGCDINSLDQARDVVERFDLSERIRSRALELIRVDFRTSGWNSVLFDTSTAPKPVELSSIAQRMLYAIKKFPTRN